MKISIKTQTARSTKFQEGINCVNCSLGNFEVGLETRRWGVSDEGEHRITFEIDGNDYSIPLDVFKKKAKTTIKILSKKYGKRNDR